jgi:predicted metalloprotease with PDZ domain
MPYSIEQTDDQLTGTTSAIRYHVTFPQAAQHLLHVTMEIDTDQPELVLSMPAWLPGSYKVRDFIAYQADVRVENSAGTALPYSWIDKHRMRIESAGSSTIVVRYSYYAFDRSVRQSHVNRFHAFFNPGNCLMYVEGRTDEIHHVQIDNPWSKISTALSPVADTVWGALNYDILVDSPVELGDHYTTIFERHGKIHEIAITGQGNYDPDWIAGQTKIIVDRAVDMWKDLPYDRYLFILQLVPGGYGGLEHARCSVNMFDAHSAADKEKTVKLLTLLCHEYFHLWNVKRIRAVELGPFDYSKENYTSMLWLAEGITSYYDDLMSYRCGFHSREEYLKTLSKDHLGRLWDTPGRFAMSIKDSSYLAWVKLYMSTPDSVNRFPSYYLKGGVIMLLLDLSIIADTNGERSLDDAMRALMQRYLSNPSTGITEDEFVTTVVDATGVDVRERFLHWLNSTDELPVADVVDRVGLRWSEKQNGDAAEQFGADLDYQQKAPERLLGVTVDDKQGGVKVIRVLRDTPAEEAGIGIDDELIAINGVRISSKKNFEAFLQNPHLDATLQIVGASEGQIYDTTVQLKTRTTYELVAKEDPGDEERLRLDAWLARSVPQPSEVA